jgi:hypothetical protein
MNKDDFFKQDNLVKDSGKIEVSPSGKYELLTSKYTTKEGCWNYSRGIIRNRGGGVIADVKRNYSHFPFCWVEDHQSGHDYLVCGEDYQGQTIIELDTGNRKDYLPEEAKKGFGFCWVSVHPSPNKNILAVNGCIWAGPYEVLFVDFSNPMKELIYLEKQPEGYYPEFYGWNDDGTANIGYEEIRRKSDGKPEKDLTDEEQDKMYDDGNYEEVPIKTIWKIS